MHSLTSVTVTVVKVVEGRGGRGAAGYLGGLESFLSKTEISPAHLRLGMSPWNKLKPWRMLLAWSEAWSDWLSVSVMVEVWVTTL